MRIAIIGSGPAGVYLAEHLLQRSDLSLKVHFIERLPTPWGLIRSGVAPDHPEKKWVANRLFQHTMSHPDVVFHGNVEVGSDVKVSDLEKWFDAVIIATGAGSSKSLDIKGGNLKGVDTARDFVNWYNGHPDAGGLDFPLDAKRVVIAGNGNVALDIARMFCTPYETLAKTDIADHALEALRDCSVEEITILGRREAHHIAGNNPELEEFGALDDVSITVSPQIDSSSLDTLDWTTRRKLITLKSLSERQSHGAHKQIHFRFNTQPIEILGKTHVEGVKIREKTAPDEHETVLDAGYFLSSIGYRGLPLDGLPFDIEMGIIPNEQGRVSTERGNTFVVGWIKRGPSGVIGTNKACAAETAHHLLRYLGKAKTLDASLSDEGFDRFIQHVLPGRTDWTGWLRIDRRERLEGRGQYRPRVKICDRKNLYAVAVTKEKVRI